ncbi:MAG: thrombospondin type 3 repeat-containing protein [Thermoplasmatota archaeon]
MACNELAAGFAMEPKSAARELRQLGLGRETAFTFFRGGPSARGTTLFRAAILLAVAVSGGALLAGGAHASAVISDGRVALGVESMGELGVQMAPSHVHQPLEYPASAPVARSENCAWYGRPNSGAGSNGTVVSLRYLPSSDDAMDCDMEGEGWGVSYVENGSTVKGAVRTVAGCGCDGVLVPQVLGSLRLLSFNATQTTALSRTQSGNVVVEQLYHPVPGVPGAYDDRITLSNVGSSTVDVAYRRQMSWVSSGSPHDFWVDQDCGNTGCGLGGTNSDIEYIALTYVPGRNLPADSALVGTCEVRNPSLMGGNVWTAPGARQPGSCPGRQGPPAQDLPVPALMDGAGFWDFDFGLLPAAESKTIDLYYGAEENRAEALAALAATNADVYSMAMPDHTQAGAPAASASGGDQLADEPAVFFMAFGNITKWSPSGSFGIMATTCDDPTTTYPGGAVDFVGHWGAHEVGSWNFGDGTPQVQGSEVRHVYGNRDTRYTVTVTITNPAAPGRPAAYQQEVTPYDCPPRLDSIPDSVVEFGHAIEPNCFHAFDADDPGGNLTWHYLDLPKGAIVDGTQCLHFTPAIDQIHDYQVYVRVCDRNNCAIEPFWIDVWAPSPAGGPPPCIDSDYDGVCDPADNCPAVPNHDQRDSVGNGVGDACRGFRQPVPKGWPGRPRLRVSDLDRDGIPDNADNCPVTPNRDQADLDGDGIGDVCDNDVDGDGIPNWAPERNAVLDNCPRVPNPDQRDADGDGVGDACKATVARLPGPGNPPRQPAAAVVPPVGPSAPTWAALAALSAAAAVVWWWLRRPSLLVLFSRLAGLDLLRNASRARIVACIDAEPGIHYKALVRALRMSRGLAQHHMRVLVAAGLVAQCAEGRSLRYYLAGAPRSSTPLKSDVARSPRAQNLLAFVHDHPGSSPAEIARALGAPRTRVSYHAKRLAEAGLVRVERSKHRVLVFPPLERPGGPPGRTP